MTNLFLLLSSFVLMFFNDADSVPEVNFQNNSEQIQQLEIEEKNKNLFKVVRVVDGDTIELENGEKVRYIGIDTPETKHPTKKIECYGEEASDKNKQLVEGKEVRLEKDVSETDRYGRILRYIYVDDVFINEYLVKEGFAKSSSYPPDIKYQDRLKEAEQYARNNSKGLWGEACEVETIPIPTEEPIITKKIVIPTIEPSIQPIMSPTMQPIIPPASNIYSCNCSKTCSQMSSCNEAYYQLNNCGCSKRDGDDDGVPCETICSGG